MDVEQSSVPPSSNMTYNVFGGTLNLAQSNQSNLTYDKTSVMNN